MLPYDLEKSSADIGMKFDFSCIRAPVTVKMSSFMMPFVL